MHVRRIVGHFCLSTVSAARFVCLGAALILDPPARPCEHVSRELVRVCGSRMGVCGGELVLGERVGLPVW